MLRALRSLFRHASAPRPYRCRPEVELLERRDVPTAGYVTYQGVIIGTYHGFTAVEGENFTDLEANFFLSGPLGQRPGSDYRVDINYGDGTPTDVGTLVLSHGDYLVYGTGHVYSHWTAPNEGFPDYNIMITVTPLHPAPAETPIVFQGTAAVFPAATDVHAQTITGTVGQSFSGQVATFELPNADEITSTPQATVVWNDGDVSSTDNGKASIRHLGGDEFAVYVTGHTFQRLDHVPVYQPGSPPYGGPYPYGFTVYASTRPHGLQGGRNGFDNGTAVVDFSAEFDTPGGGSGPSAPGGEGPPARPAPPPSPVRPTHSGHHRTHHTAAHASHHAHRPDLGRGDGFFLRGADGSVFDQNGRFLHGPGHGRIEATLIGADGSVFDEQGRLLHRAGHGKAAGSGRNDLERHMRRILELVNPEAQQQEQDLKNALDAVFSNFRQ